MKILRRETGLVLDADAIRFTGERPFPIGIQLHAFDGDPATPMLDEPDGLSVMKPGDWIFHYSNGERWRRSAENFEEFYKIVNDDAAEDIDDAPVGDLSVPHAPQTLTVRELYDLLEARRLETNDFAGEAGTMEIILRVQDGDDLLVGGLTSLAIDAGCTEIYALVMDGDAEAESRDTELAAHELHK